MRNPGAETELTISGQPIALRLTSGKGTHFTDFYVRQDRLYAPGWFIFGRNPAYSGLGIMLVARPAVRPRRTASYNVAVRRGWKTKAAAQAICDILLRNDISSPTLRERLGPLLGADYTRANGTNSALVESQIQRSSEVEAERLARFAELANTVPTELDNLDAQMRADRVWPVSGEAR